MRSNAPITRVGALARPAPTFTAVHKIVLAIAGIGILTASAYVSVPFFPVPLTMQTLAVLLLGGLLGPTMAASSVAGYLAIGAMGAPVFHNGLGGLAVLAGPTAGYLVGFIPAAAVMGLAVRRARRTPGRAESDVVDRSGSAVVSCADSAVVSRANSADGSGLGAGRLDGWRALAVLAVGAVVSSAVIYAVGVPWLAVFTGKGLLGAAQIGAVPFLLGDALKAAVAIGAIRIGGNFLARRGLLLH
ncbi:MAG: biotin transporter BioY [Actinobacteria bacterium]|nr:biotin transporter BioY [Actinomycetota bacterium]